MIIVLDHSEEEITAYVYGVFWRIPFPFSLPNSNACVDSGLNCPVTPEDNEVIYHAGIYVSEYYPSVSLLKNKHFSFTIDQCLIIHILPGICYRQMGTEG